MSQLRKTAPVLLAWLVLLLCQNSVVGEERRSSVAGEQINWQVISSGGENDGVSASYGLAGTVGQTATGTGSSASYGVKGGFWQEFAAGPEYVCGDADGNAIVNISDAVFLIAYIFGGGPAPDPLLSGDCDCNEIVNISDAVYLIAYIFGGGPSPCQGC